MSYCLKNTNGVELDRADKDKPFAYLHGTGQMIPGLEKELEGLGIGDKKDVTVPPSEGYGELNPQLKMQVNRANFPNDADIQPGMQFEGQGDGGNRAVFTVKAVVGDKIDVDGGIGPATLKAIQNLELERVRAYRVLRFANLVIKKPEQERFWFGWYRRATEV